MASALLADRVDVLPLQEAFLASGLTAGDVARCLGWARTHTNGGGYRCRVADSSRVKRMLGLRRWKRGQGGHFYVRRINYDTALRIAGALGVDPVDVGL